MLLQHLFENEMAPPKAVSAMVAKTMRELVNVIKPDDASLDAMFVRNLHSNEINISFYFDYDEAKPKLATKDFKAVLDKFNIPGLLHFSMRTESPNAYVIDFVGDKKAGYTIDGSALKKELQKAFSDIRKDFIHFT